MSAPRAVRAVLEATGVALWRMPAGRVPELFLTFDDGPHPVHTPQVVDALRQHGVRACFFMSGAEAQRYPDVVRQVLEAGHGVANHGFFHLSARHLSARGYVANAVHGHATLESAAARRLPRLFRPPYGQIPLGGFLALRRRGYRFVLWSQDSGESGLEGDTVHIRANLAPELVGAGEIVLLHDDNRGLVQALPGAIERLQRAGFRFGRLDEVLVPGTADAGASSIAASLADGGKRCAG